MAALELKRRGLGVLQPHRTRWHLGWAVGMAGRDGVTHLSHSGNFLDFWKQGTPRPGPLVPPWWWPGEGGCRRCLSAASDESARPNPRDLYSLIRHHRLPTRARVPGSAPAGAGPRGTVPPHREGTEVMKFVNGECLGGWSRGSPGAQGAGRGHWHPRSQRRAALAGTKPRPRLPAPDRRRRPERRGGR